ncbi:Uncharacterised protein [Mycobacteroides abscessus subsp. abscessus]|nr:Uncharacterised protein [Mycobacteroides abscessus subsp. abscessus]
MKARTRTTVDVLNRIFLRSFLARDRAISQNGSWRGSLM